MKPIPEEQPVALEPEDDPVCCESCQGQQSEQVLEYVTKIREAIALQGQRIKEETTRAEIEQGEKEEKVVVENKVNGKKKRESLLRTLSTRGKDGLTQIRSKGRRVSMLLSKKAENNLDLQLEISNKTPSLGSQTETSSIKIHSYHSHASEVGGSEEHRPDASSEEVDSEEAALLSTRAPSSTSSPEVEDESEHVPLAQSYRTHSEAGYRQEKSRFRRKVESAHNAASHVKYAAIGLLSVRRRMNGWSRLEG